MPRKGSDRVERRRPMAEINLIYQTRPKAKLSGRRTGCLQVLTGISLAILAAAGAWAGLH